MKVVKDSQIENTEFDVNFTGGHSLRMIRACDGLGFSVNKTMIPKGGPHLWYYQYHKEVCYCISGKGVVTDINTNETYYIEPGILYALPNHERMTFEALTDVVLISIFNPPLTGYETHDENGTYKLETI